MRNVQRSFWISLISIVSSLGIALSVTAPTFASTLVSQPGIGNVTGSDVTPAGMAPADTQQAKD